MSTTARQVVTLLSALFVVSLLLHSPTLAKKTKLIFWDVSKVSSQDFNFTQKCLKPGVRECLMTQAITQFEVEQDEIEIDYRHKQDILFDDLKSCFAGDMECPDIITVTASQFPWLADQGKLEPLSEYILDWNRETRFDQTSAYSAKMTDIFQFEGVWEAIPLRWNMRHLWYRKDIFREVFGHDRAPKTLDDMYDMAKQINKTRPNTWGMGLPISTSGSVFTVATKIFQSYGGEWWDENEKSNVRKHNALRKMLKYYKRAADAGIMPLPNKRQGPITNVELKKLFLSGDSNPLGLPGLANFTGDVAMAIDFNYWGGSLEFKANIGMADIPAGPFGHHNAIGAQGLAILHNSKHKDETWRFLQHLVTPTRAKTRGGAQQPAFILSDVVGGPSGFSTRIETYGPASRSSVPQLRTLPYHAVNLKPPYNAIPKVHQLDMVRSAVTLTYPRASNPIIIFLEGDVFMPTVLADLLGGKDIDDIVEDFADEFDAQVTEYRAPTPYDTIHTLENNWMVPMLVVNSVLLFLTLVGAMANICLRSYAHFHYASLVFCMIVWFGCALAFVSLYWWIIQPPQDSMCYMRLWFAPLAFMIAFGPLTSKACRLNILFKNKKFKVVVMNNMEILLWTTCMAIPVVIVCAVWSVVGNPSVKFVDVAYQDETHFQQCDYDHYWVFMGLLYVYFGVILLANCVLAFRVRNASAAFNESKEMICAVYSVTVLAAICLPLVHVFHDHPEAGYVIAICGAWAAISIFLGSLFAWKFAMVMRGKSGHFSNFNKSEARSGSRGTATFGADTLTHTLSLSSANETSSNSSVPPGVQL
eukprot:TRINITY_DN10693_c0_g1_i1.p1 TRINITY_DN10693_c0_g1~~TRINITY_DN10693_c0_g1_i1.p1  ORF type:complete len:845 (-),score=135.37 TRINITY_DN10693_c0_g1_i1:144-2585(-)